MILREAYAYLGAAADDQDTRTDQPGCYRKTQLIQASFSQAFSDRSNIRLNPALGGGAARCQELSGQPVQYPGREPGAKRVQAVARWSDDALDRLVAMIDFANGVLAQISCSFATAFHREAVIAGMTASSRPISPTMRGPEDIRSLPYSL